MKQRNHRTGCRALALLLCLVLALGSFAGCQEVEEMVSGGTGGEFPVEVNGVTIAARPQKVVVLSPSLADVILALGCETQLAAAGEGCVQEHLAELPKVSPDDPQAIQDLAPDLVLLDAGSNRSQNVLEEAGVTVLSIDPATDREDFERLYAQVSSALQGGGPGYDEGIAAAQDVFGTLDDINRIVPKDKVTTACYLYDLEGSAVTGDQFGSTVMSYAGVTNVFQSLEGGQYDFRTLEIANPNVIFCVPGLKEQIEADSRFDQFQAVEQGKVVEMDPSLMEWQGRTIIEAAYEISAAAFPELLEEGSSQVSDPTEDIESQVSSAMEEQSQYETLQQGDDGDAVEALQVRLSQLGYLTEAYDGHYGEVTAGCVEAFQAANGLEATGVADPATQAALFAQGALRADGTPLPEEAGESSASSQDSSAAESSESSASQGDASSESPAPDEGSDSSQDPASQGDGAEGIQVPVPEDEA